MILAAPSLLLVVADAARVAVESLVILGARGELLGCAALRRACLVLRGGR